MTRKELLPQDILEKIPSLGYNKAIPANDIRILVKLFLANFTWLVAECEVQKDGDVMFYGYVENHSDPHFSEWGHFMLSQLVEVKLFDYFVVERDLYFNGCTFGEYMRSEG